MAGDASHWGRLATRCLLLLAWPLLGCAPQPAGIVAVSGRVTLHGQPLAGAVVTFQPVHAGDSSPRHGGSVGRTDRDGRFVLRLIEPDVEGAAIGTHVVTISTAQIGAGDAARPVGERVPKAWLDGSQTFEVSAEGTSSASFDLP